MRLSAVLRLFKQDKTNEGKSLALEILITI